MNIVEFLIAPEDWVADRFTFTVPGEPASKARARFSGYGSKTRTYTPEKTVAAEQKVAWTFKSAGGVYEPDPEVTFAVEITFYNGTRQRRDIDNMIKLVFDALNKVAWVDDTQVMEVSARKSYVPKADARTEVTIRRVGVMNRLTKTCEHCDEDFVTYKSLQRQRFCSRECGDAARRAARTRSCRNCGEPFLSPKPGVDKQFCTEECKSAYARRDVVCDWCGETFSKLRCHVRPTNYCCPEHQSLKLNESRRTRGWKPKGDPCVTCGTPTSKKGYRQCGPCRLTNRESAA